jgi:hypothetical protein
MDLWIAMESILSASGGEAQHRMSLLAARILRPADVRSFIRRFKNAYGLRSGVVHGSSEVRRKKLKDSIDWTYQTLCDLLIDAVKRHSFPDLDSLEDEMVTSR